MKRFSIILLAGLIIFSFLLAGCIEDETEDDLEDYTKTFTRMAMLHGMERIFKERKHLMVKSIICMPLPRPIAILHLIPKSW